MMKLRKPHSYDFLKLSWIQKVSHNISYNIEREFVFELSLISLENIDA